MGAVRSPPGLRSGYESKNAFQILRSEDLLDESDSGEIGENDFPEVWQQSRTKKGTRMPKMPNYSQNSVKKKEFNIFIKKQGSNVSSNDSFPRDLHRFVGNKRDEHGWLKLKGVMDPGASESVAPPSMAPHYEITSSPGLRAGQIYTSASNNDIENMGEQVLEVVMEDGRASTVKCQIADVSRPLNSISEICDAGGPSGQVVVFGRNGDATLKLQTGQQTPFQREDGVYVVEVWVKPKGFPRQGC